MRAKHEASTTRASVPDPLLGEIERRACNVLGDRYLAVDYYRIRRRLAFRLPVAGLPAPRLRVPDIADYPWATWMLWALEERVLSLGWTAEWTADSALRQDAAEAAERDLAALARWPRYNQYNGPDLSSAHAARILWTAAAKWRWPSEALRALLRQACRAHAACLADLSDAAHGRYTSASDILAAAEPCAIVGNIGFIGTIGAALTARVSGHESLPRLDARVRLLFDAILALRGHGVVEGVAYDGYMLDFVADWLEGQPPGVQDAVLAHPSLDGYLVESCALGAPGAQGQAAELSDVEPRQMPFHLSAHAKVNRQAPHPHRTWLLDQVPVAWLRTDALAARRTWPAGLESQPPATGALHAHYAVVLRTGWGHDGLAVAAACSSSPMSHIQCDSGSLVIGTRGRWIIADPGYQQYMHDDERAFTLGVDAHNAPVLNGHPQFRKAPHLVTLDQAGGALHATIELTDCYPAEARARCVRRAIWVPNARVVAVADRVEADGLDRIAYAWHGDPAAAWAVQEGWAFLHLPGVDLWFTSPQAEITDSLITRLPGSRGQLTLRAELAPPSPIVWWVFAVQDAPPPITVLDEGRAIAVDGVRLGVPD